MTSCEMCGREGAELRAEVEHVRMQVCTNCARHGKLVTPPKAPITLKAVHSAKPELIINENYSSLLKKTREKLNMTQEEFAKHVQERESVITKWEQGSLSPSLETAQKLGNILGLSLVAKSQMDTVSFSQKEVSNELTLGDFVKIRKNLK